MSFSTSTSTLPEPARLLAERFARVLAFPRGDVYVKVELEAPPTHPLAWLAAQAPGPRLYWHSRHSGTRVAGIGAALTLEGNDPETLRGHLNRLGPNARLYGGTHFDPLAQPDGSWTPLTGYRYVLPRFTYTLYPDGSAKLAAHAIMPQDRKRRLSLVKRALHLANPLNLERMHLPLPISREDLPNRQQWQDTMHLALSQFAQGQLDKVVLARRVTFQFPEPLEPHALLYQLEESTPHCFHFMVSSTPNAAFVSATPERLFLLRDGRLRTEAVAGTRPRGVEPGEDERLHSELMDSEKDHREHAFVRDFLIQKLTPLADHLHADVNPGEMTLSRGRHLRSRLEAVLKPETHPLDVLSRLHPTPAVGGTPTSEALAFLREHEPFERGRYAAPFGWISAQGAEFAVGIRSGRVEKNVLALYSGAGIVPGSDPEAEWQEIEAKIADFVSVLGLEQRP